MEIGKFQPPQKIRHNWLRRQGEPIYQIWYKSIHWGQSGEM